MVQKLISLEEVARITDSDRSWWERKIRRGEIPAVRLGRRVRLRVKDLENIVESGFPPRKKPRADMAVGARLSPTRS